MSEINKIGTLKTGIPLTKNKPRDVSNEGTYLVEGLGEHSVFPDVSVGDGAPGMRHGFLKVGPDSVRICRHMVIYC